MAIYYVDPVSGNNANSGLTTALAKQTIAGAVAVPVVAQDEIHLMNGTHVLTAQVTPNVNLVIQNYIGHSPVITGGFNFTNTTSVQARFKGLNFQNAAGTNGQTGAVGSNNTGNRYVFEDCTFDYATPGYTNAPIFLGSPSTLAFYNCTFIGCNTGVASQGAVFTNCTFKNFIQNATPTSAGYVLAPSTLNVEFIGCKFQRIGVIIRHTSNTNVDNSSFKYCTFDLKDGLGSGVNGHFCVYSNASSPANANLTPIRITNCLIVNAQKMIHNALAGKYTLNNSFIRNNWIQSGISLTGYTSFGGDITAYTDPKFYNAATNDYRLEADSTAARQNNGLNESMGAEELEHPSVFFTSIDPSKVELSYAYRVLSRTNNKTGTLAGTLLNVANVKIGVDRGDGNLGTYDGSDRWSDVGIANVRSGSAYKANSTSNNRTGTLDLPATTDVKTGVQFDGATKTGSYDGSDRWSDPGIANVRSGTAYKANSATNNRTGSLDLPAQSDVKEGVQYDNATKTGTLHLTVTDNILASELKIGVTKTVKDVSVVGTYDGSDRFTVPTEAQVKTGVSFKDNNVNKTGSYTGAERFDVPAESDVREGVEYTDNLVDKIGTLHLEQTDDIMEGDLKIGVTKIVKDVEVTGTYDGAERFSLPTEDEVLDGVEFMDNTVEKTGNVVLPPESSVRDGVQYGPNNSMTGTADVDQLSIDPGVGNVLKGVEYNIDGVDLIGEYDTGQGDITPDESNIRIKVLKKIEDKLYGIDPAKNARYQNVVRSVSFEPVVKEGLIQDDYPHVQIAAEENQYDHGFVLSGDKPLVTMRVRLIITTPGNWNALDAESLYEDIRQCFIRDNFMLDGLVISTKVEGFIPLTTDSDKEDQNRKGQLSMVFKFIEIIE